MNHCLKRFYALICLSALTGFWVTAQHSNRVNGVIADSSSGEPVGYAQILNFTSQKQMYSNLKGEFSLEAAVGDTLVIYGPGYFYEKVFVDEKMLSGKPVKLFLNHQPYNLSTANITGIGSYDDFREKLITMETPMTKTDILNRELGEAAKSAATEAYRETMNKRYLENGVTFLSVGIYSPEEIERKRLAKIMAKENVRDQVYHKFNPVVVKEITGLTDDSEIIQFMLYCNFSDSYILESNTYELTERIAAKFELFKKKKEEEKHNSDPVNFIEEIFGAFV